MTVPASAVREQVQRLLTSPQLAHSEALARLLRFVVDETLEGRGEQLKETRLGLEVFGRRAGDYDAAIDPIVRVQMGRLRNRLGDYYARAGAADPVIIEIPKGGYVPVFRCPKPVERAPTPAPRHRLAVLPFVNMSTAAGSEYFSDGLTEELIHVLARDPGLQVVARTSTFQFKEQARDIREIGRQLEVGSILEGSVRQSGSRVRVTAQLINVADGCHVWSERYDRELTDIFAIHDEIAAAIHGALHARLAQSADRPSAAGHTGTLEAYNHYLLGRCLWNNRTAQGLRAALGHFQQAVKLDPQYARAHAGMADCHVLLGLSGAAAPGDSMPPARQAAERALEIDPELAEAHASLAAASRIFERDCRAAAAGFRKAMALDPNYATAHHWNGLMNLAMAGRFAEAVEELERAVELDPLAGPIIADLGMVHCFADEHDECESDCRRALELAPYFHRPYWFLGLSLAVRGDFAAAEQALQRALMLCPDDAFRSRVLGSLGFCYGRARKREPAEAILRELTVLAKTRYVPRWDVAQVHAGLGNRAEALGELEAAATARETYVMFTPVWPAFRELRTDPRMRRVAGPAP